jgi:LysM repeat protein
MPKQIRCMHCYTQASSELVVCPGCGRELREAPPKLVTLGLPVVLALLLVALVVSQWERVSPIAWARSNFLRGVILMEGLSASFEPEMVIVMTPIVENSAGSAMGNAPAESLVVHNPQAVALNPAGSLVTAVPEANHEQIDRPSILAAAVADESPIGVGGPRATATANSATSAAATEPSAAKEVAVTSATEEPTRTPAPAASTAAVDAVRGEGGGALAQVGALAASESTIPTATPVVATTPLPTPTVTPVVYQVRAGDTLVTIASVYDVDVEALMAANDISEQDVYVIQPGQMLLIPVPAPADEAIVQTASDQSALRLEAPVLLAPAGGATVACESGEMLRGQRVRFVKDSDKYVLHLGFVVEANVEANNEATGEGRENVVWVLAQSAPVTQTEWELDGGLCDLAPATSDRQWRWWVEVVEEVDGRTVAVSPPSEIRGFVWK